MLIGNGSRYFGFWDELPLSLKTGESFYDYLKLKNTLSREGILRYMEALPVGLMVTPDPEQKRDVFTGEPVVPGMYKDGVYIYPSEFLHYYRKYPIGIPYEYEDYLRKQGVK